uniref:Uncharacterized protein n=1 Tax=Anguilla anguilla TaxID=7936 RepID=A0A0E9V025_ANGAN
MTGMEPPTPTPPDEPQCQEQPDQGARLASAPNTPFTAREITRTFFAPTLISKVAPHVSTNHHS